jgi:protein TonB
MKAITRLLFFLLPFTAFSQNVAIDKPQEATYATGMIDKVPEFPGGISEFYKYIGNHFNLPHERPKGKIIMTFIVEKDGSLGEIKIMKNEMSPEIGLEAIRVLNSCPKWLPGIKDGKEVRVSYAVPINLQ